MRTLTAAAKDAPSGTRGRGGSTKDAHVERGTVNRVVALNRRVGNRATGLLLQTKLRVGAPNDRYEQEADRVADTVMRTPSPVVQRSCVGCAGGASCAECAEEEAKVRRTPSTASAPNTFPTITRLASGDTDRAQRQEIEDEREREEDE